MTSSKSWRDVLPVHPAAELLPMMSKAELKELGEDIRKHGLHEKVALLDDMLLDGRNRLDAMEMVGIKVVVSGKLDIDLSRNVQGANPFDYVMSKNICRRHLTAEQRGELIAEILKATPDRSDRRVAEMVKASHVTVGAVRSKLESTGQIDQLTKTVGKDGKRRASKPCHKPAREKVVERPSARSGESQHLSASVCAVSAAAQGQEATVFDLVAHMIAEEAECLSGDRRTEFLTRLRDVVEGLLHNENAIHMESPPLSPPP